MIAAGENKGDTDSSSCPKASQILGMKFAHPETTGRSTAVIIPNLLLSEERGLAEAKRSPSKLRSYLDSKC